MYSREAIGFVEVSSKKHTFMGGAPYLDDSGYPTSRNGQPYDFIFQIDTVEAGLEDYPAGVLQFFTAPDDLNGMDLDGVFEGDTLVRFLPEGTFDSEEERNPIYSDYTPLSNPEERKYYHSKIVKMTPFQNSIEYQDMIENMDEDIDEDDYFDESYNNQSFEFYLGGFPDFTQADFRESIDAYPSLIAGSISGKNIMWGDMGSAGWWVEDDSDLEHHDYENAFFYWDCA